MKTAALKKLRKKLAADHPAYGLWVTLESASITEMGVALGLDWLVIDAEHGHLDWKDILEHIRATVRSETVALVRVAEFNAGLIKRALDIGADGVVVPWIETAEQLKQACGICAISAAGRSRHRGGTRDGLGPMFCPAHAGSQRKRARRADHRIRDRREKHQGALRSSTGVELVFLGPADYSSTAGFRGQWEGPGVAKELLAIKDTLRANRKHCGVIATSHENLIERRLQGFRLLALGTDSGLFLRSLHGSLGIAGRDRQMSASFAPENATLPLTPLSRPPESLAPRPPGK